MDVLIKLLLIPNHLVFATEEASQLVRAKGPKVDRAAAQDVVQASPEGNHLRFYARVEPELAR
eukprot:CAMPEP_0206426766 /NCGR_PEP_ID=MMETSP0324_2-20121206/4591_1 /ASSEMBLY_ACC=CAM_ASM_000836 /TAXON_ID=2866 /ORGANISM="Crypthecodinium cohnii, Strain Seligo" /LENGTH=62 /DNA_ID=CAMNT_0053891819 /DNA_START=367 /DNA_END=555 /DNA_ORIENTATION=-